MRLIVLPIGPASRQLDLLGRAVVAQRFIPEHGVRTAGASAKCPWRTIASINVGIIAFSACHTLGPTLPTE
jgi:hypothetical protein